MRSRAKWVSYFGVHYGNGRCIGSGVGGNGVGRSYLLVTFPASKRLLFEVATGSVRL
jgi:hypothetical protein